MIERLHNYLARMTEGASASDLLNHLFDESSRDADFGRELVQLLLARDPRFTVDEDGHWVAVDDHVLHRPMDEATYVVVDLETTGQGREQHGVMEIGAIRVENGEEVGRFDQLVNPGRKIPGFVTQLTGIRDEMVADSPPIKDVIGPFYEFTRGAVLVAHNAGFDEAVLDGHCHVVLGKPLGLPSLCTVKVAQRLYPDLTRTSLDALAEHFTLKTPARHRAMGDTELTVQLLKLFIEKLKGQGKKSVSDLLAAQDGPKGRRDHSVQVGLPALEDLPLGAGVYTLRGSDGKALMVSRAATVRRRVMEHFLDIEHASDRQMEMIDAVRSIEAVACGSELESAIVEAQVIRREDPAYNRPGKHIPKSYFACLSSRGSFPRIHVQTRVRPDGSLYVGPLRGRRLGTDVADLMAAAYGLRTCDGRLDPNPEFEACDLKARGYCISPCDASAGAGAYDERVAKLRADLDDPEWAPSAWIEAVPGDRSVPGRFISASKRLARRKKPQRWVVNTRHYLAVAPGVGGGLYVVPVVAGRSLHPEHIRDLRQFDNVVAAIVDAVAKPGPLKPNRNEADRSTILTHWVQGGGRPEDEHVLEFSTEDFESVASVQRAAVEAARKVSEASEASPASETPDAAEASDAPEVAAIPNPTADALREKLAELLAARDSG